MKKRIEVCKEKASDFSGVFFTVSRFIVDNSIFIYARFICYRLITGGMYND